MTMLNLEGSKSRDPVEMSRSTALGIVVFLLDRDGSAGKADINDEVKAVLARMALAPEEGLRFLEETFSGQTQYSILFFVKGEVVQFSQKGKAYSDLVSKKMLVGDVLGEKEMPLYDEEVKEIGEASEDLPA